MRRIGSGVPRYAWLVLAGVALLAAALIVGLQDSSPQDPAEAPSPVVAVRARQEAVTLHLEWTGTPRGAPRKHGSLCAMLRGAAAPGTPVVCVRGGSSPSVVMKRGGAVSPLRARVTRTGATSLAVELDSRDLRLGAGPLRALPLSRSGDPAKARTVRPLAWRKVVRTGCARPTANKIVRGPRGIRRVALSFDDGPSTATPAVLATLNRHGAHATFFMVGQNALVRPDLVRRVVAQGSGVGNHSWAHARYPTRSDLERTNRALARISGYTPCLFRPPYGLMDRRLSGDVAARGMASVMWSIDTNDWRRGGVQSITSAASRARAGDIVLMHDGGGPRGETVAALEFVLRGLSRRGLKVVSVEELMGATPTFAER